MTLLELNKQNINEILTQHHEEGGTSVNTSLSKLFSSLNDEEHLHEVMIKVAALNQIYSTSIQYIIPVVEKIIEIIDNKHDGYGVDEYVSLVDQIATVSWVSPTTGKEHTRCNLSFSSKYIHFLSGLKTPIYDSYIWILMIGYLNQNTNNTKLSFSAPTSYLSFYNILMKFKVEFKLEEYSNYDLDKFLWQYGKNVINEISMAEDVSLDKAKSKLKKMLTPKS
ncbi:Putative uncharacterized protein [Moritella viscosa]|uniref:hypothetical protein n=1 Tax=Moritella viscosa TaxID=80854 RepID=UPI000914B62F|nr:hypothetical protein [Moritella viscosa]SGY81518.1 Putative uncharacterized protein [Moritella viscosa]